MTANTCATCNHVQEVWQAAPGFEGLYEVSDGGRVRSLARPRRNYVYLLRPTSVADGYHQVSLWRDGKSHRFRVHALVMESFVGPLPSGMLVRHLDGDPAHNCRLNLTYGTPSQNSDDSVRHGTHVNARKTHCPQGHPYDELNTARNHKSRLCRECIKAGQRKRRALEAAT